MKVKQIVGYSALGVAGLAGLIVLAFGLEMGSLKWKGFFAPKHEDVRREVFKATRSYNEGKTQDLAKYRREYMRSTSDEERAMIASTINVQFADYQGTELPGELQQFLQDIRGY